MIIYNRNSKGDIDKSSVTFVESQKTVDNSIKEFLEGSELNKDLEATNKKISYLESESLNTQLALVEVYELLILTEGITPASKTISIGGNSMVTVYVSLIVKGAKTFDEVPEKIKADVKAELELLGLGHLAR